MTETSVSPRPFTSVWSDLREVEFSQGFLQAGPYRTRYLHAGDPSKPTLVLWFLPTFVIWGLAKSLEGAAYNRHVAAGGSRGSSWRAAASAWPRSRSVRCERRHVDP